MPSTASLCNAVAHMVELAATCVPAARGQALLQGWLNAVDLSCMSEHGQLCTLTDAVMLARNLNLSQPSHSGATAFDRLARSRPGSTPEHAAALKAVCAARFRLMQVESSLPGGRRMVRDLISGQSLRIADGGLEWVAVGIHLFARVALLGDGDACLAGPGTPLDEAALAVARAHASAGTSAPAAAARWVEAIYARVVRHGTLDIPGLNRPRPGVFPEDDSDINPMMALARTWASLGEASPDEDLLARTRALANEDGVIGALSGAATVGDARAIRAQERIIGVLLETVMLRARIGSGGLTLDGLDAAVDAAIRHASLPPGARKLWRTLREAAARAHAPADPGSASLLRLMQTIQGLRAKTVERGCTEAEALAAAEKVAELLDRHGLSLGELEFRAQPCDGATVQTNRKRAGPIDSCVQSIGAFFDCRVWAEQAPGATLRYVFFGLRADVAATQYLYELVERAFITETDNFRAGPIYAAMAGERRTASNSFQIGMARAIRGKLQALRDARDIHRKSATGHDLVLMKSAMVDDEIAKLGLHFQKMGGATRRHVLTEAFEAGEAAGQRFEWTPGIAEAA